LPNNKNLIADESKSARNRGKNVPLEQLQRKLSTIAVLRTKKSKWGDIRHGRVKTENREGRNDNPCALSTRMLSPRVGLLFLSPPEMRIFTYVCPNVVVAYSRRFILKAKRFNFTRFSKRLFKIARSLLLSWEFLHPV